MAVARLGGVGWVGVRRARDGGVCNAVGAGASGGQCRTGGRGGGGSGGGGVESVDDLLGLAAGVVVVGRREGVGSGVRGLLP